jgi:protein disulfide-isomerase
MFGFGKATETESEFQSIASNSSAVESKSRVALASYQDQSSGEEIASWLDSFEKAVEVSNRTGKPILTNFTGRDWCGYCVKLHKEVFATKTFQNWAAENVVLLELDYPKKKNNQPQWLRQQNQQLKERYQISGFPTVLLLTANGKVIGKLGYMNDAAKWVSVANNSLAAEQSLRSAKFIEAADLETTK